MHLSDIRGIPARAIQQTFDQMFDCSVETVEPEDADEFSDIEFAINASIMLTNEEHGCGLTLLFPKDSCSFVLSMMLDDHGPPDSRVVQDGLGELCTVIARAMIAEIEIEHDVPLDLGLPVVATGHEHDGPRKKTEVESFSFLMGNRYPMAAQFAVFDFDVDENEDENEDTRGLRTPELA